MGNPRAGAGRSLSDQLSFARSLSGCRKTVLGCRIDRCCDGRGLVGGETIGVLTCATDLELQIPKGKMRTDEVRQLGRCTDGADRRLRAVPRRRPCAARARPWVRARLQSLRIHTLTDGESDARMSTWRRTGALLRFGTARRVIFRAVPALSLAIQIGHRIRHLPQSK